MINRAIPRNRKPTTAEDAASVVTGFDKLQRLYSTNAAARAVLEEATGNPICVDGCGRCCERMTPVVTRLEALYMLASMSVLPSYTDLKGRAEKWMADGASALNVIDSGHGKFKIGDKGSPVAADYERLRHSPCPFLADDKTCVAYEFRPLQCRNYGVTSMAEPVCIRPLHYTESDSSRMYIDKGSPIGTRVRILAKDMVQWLNTRKPEMAQVGFLPALIVQEMSSVKELELLPAMPSQRAMRQAREK